jgi:hypothetical protein
LARLNRFASALPPDCCGHLACFINESGAFYCASAPLRKERGGGGGGFCGVCLEQRITLMRNALFE